MKVKLELKDVKEIDFIYVKGRKIGNKAKGNIRAKLKGFPLELGWIFIGLKWKDKEGVCETYWREVDGPWKEKKMGLISLKNYVERCFNEELEGK